MQISQFTLDQFRTSAQIGALVSVTIRAVGARFRIEAETRTGDIVLTTQRGQSPREFVDPTRAFSLLGELGIREYRVDANECVPKRRQRVALAPIEPLRCALRTQRGSRRSSNNRCRINARTCLQKMYSLAPTRWLFQRSESNAVRLEWRKSAAADLLAIITEIANDKPTAARKFLDKLTARVTSLADFPELGKASRRNYLVFYRFDSKCVEVVAFVHARRKWP
jgi:toxin ParE1/3/4